MFKSVLSLPVRDVLENIQIPPSSRAFIISTRKHSIAPVMFKSVLSLPVRDVLENIQIPPSSRAFLI